MTLIGHLERLAGLQAELTGQAQACLGLIRQEEFVPLEDVMERRRLLFSQIMALHQDLRRLWPDLEEAFNSLPAAEADQARGLLARLEEQSGRLSEVDRQASALLGEVLARLKSDLARLGRGQRLLNAYRPLPAGTRWGPDQLSRTG